MTAQTQPDLKEGISPVRAHMLEVWEASSRDAPLRQRSGHSVLQAGRAGGASNPSVRLCADIRWSACRLHLSAHGMIEMLFVHPAWRGHGIGRQLLVYAIDVLGATTLDVNEQNEQALGFYLHMGLEVVGRSERDDFGKPYPLLHMRVTAER